MTIGNDTAAFHFELRGQTLYTREAFEDHWWRYMEAMNAVYRPIFEKTGQRFYLPFIREVSGIGNAYAVVYRNERFVLVDPSVWGYEVNQNTAEILVYSHEIGHHVCGHTARLTENTSWERELEADQFAGLVLSLLFANADNITDYADLYRAMTLDNVIATARSIFNVEGSPGHPPADMRVAAITSGYLEGSPCPDRGVLNTPLPGAGQAPAPADAATLGSLWTHNGSVVRLTSVGASRQFRYVAPRNGLPVQVGTLLFDGAREGQTYTGTAYVFSRVCGPLGYAVSGVVSADSLRVTLYGRVPVRDSSCRVASYRDEVLVFEYERTEP